METYQAGDYDVIVIGAGHAGCEAGLASARMGMRTLVFTINIDSIAMMPCNPSIGGTGKGHLVKEIDALGGEMGINIDKAMIQCKMLNTAKGPAVHSLRAQADKLRYHTEMKHTLENTENLWIRQGEVVRICVEDDSVTGVVTRTGGEYRAKAVVVAAGTYLKGKVFIGHNSFTSGPNGLAPSMELSEDLAALGLDLRRFKTGTPARINARSMDYSAMIEQPGDEDIIPFSFMNDTLEIDQVSCWLTYTNPQTHDLIRKNIHRSAMYSGQIEGTGPRYCPSIEDKISRFADKERHQLFLEPEGLNTNEVYVQGMSTSLPEDVQEGFMRTIKGLENVEIMRPAYAIEYDYVDPIQLHASLETKSIKNLYHAGQINGTSGYEEAAGQGLLAGINAALRVKGLDPLVLGRSQAYIGVMIDDLVTLGTKEPYRMFTSRAEYRLLLREDNADLRLRDTGFKLGLVSEQEYASFSEKRSLISDDLARIATSRLANSESQLEVFASRGIADIQKGTTLEQLLKRPEICYQDLAELDPVSRETSAVVREQVEIQIKYKGYIDRQLEQVEQSKKLESTRIPADIDYGSVKSLTTEVREKLLKNRPDSLGQASRIPGVTPAAISILSIALKSSSWKGNAE